MLLPNVNEPRRRPGRGLIRNYKTYTYVLYDYVCVRSKTIRRLRKYVKSMKINNNNKNLYTKSRMGRERWATRHRYTVYN